MMRTEVKDYKEIRVRFIFSSSSCAYCFHSTHAVGQQKGVKQSVEVQPVTGSMYRLLRYCVIRRHDSLVSSQFDSANTI